MTRRRRDDRHLGLDLGATNLKWAVLSSGDGDLERRSPATRCRPARRPTPTRCPPPSSPSSPRSAADAIASWGPGVRRSGSACPGLYDPAAARPASWSTCPGRGRASRSPGPVGGGSGVPVVPDQRRAGVRPRRAAARRRPRGASSMIGLTLGTGVGGVIAIDGRVHQGHDGTAGEIGHQTIDPDGPWCGCGNRGCLEAFARADQIAAACGTATVEEAVAPRPGRRRPGDRRARPGRPLSRDRDRQHDRGHLARPGRHRRRRRGGRRPAPRPDPRRAAAARPRRRRSTRSSS